MKYKVGDRVVIKPWKLMVEQYGVYEDGDIKTNMVTLNNIMEQELAGTDRVVEIADAIDCRYHLTGRPKGWAITDDHILGYAFEYGEEIYVRDCEEDKWSKRRFIAYLPGMGYNIQAAGDDDIPRNWLYAKPIPQKEPSIEIMVKINGKESKLSDVSDETLKKIKELEK